MKYVTRPLTLSKRLILTFTAVIILTLMLAGAFCYQQTRQVIQSNQLETMTHLMSKMAGSLGTTLANAIGITEQVLYADDVYDSMFQENVTISSNQVGTFKHIQQYLYMLAEQFDFKKIRIFTNNTSLIYQTEGSYFCALDRLSSMIPIDDTVRVRTKQVQIADTYHASAIWNDYRISVVRLLLEGPKLCGAVVVDLESSSLLKGWGEEDMPVMLINREGRVLASTDESQMNAVLPKETVDDVYANVFVQDGSLCRLSSKIENSDWRLVMTLSSQALMGDAAGILSTTVCIILLSCLIAGMLVVIFSRMLTSRLKAVTQTIQGSEHVATLPGMLKHHIEEKPGDCEEIAVLIRTYNRQMARISELSLQNEHMVLRESRYRMEALRLQINSHFLYNTLASIKGYIDLHDTEAASGLVMSLASFFNRTLDRGSEYVSLLEEIETIKLYLQIQQTVYEETFSYEIQEIPQDVQNITIPKFLLQPIVENALLHGAMEATGHGYILLNTRVEDASVYIHIMDNGPGFTQDMLERSEAKHRIDRGYGIGLWNVASRLKLYFGENARLILRNRPEGGSRVSVAIPLEGLSEEARATYDQDRPCR